MDRYKLDTLENLFLNNKSVYKFEFFIGEEVSCKIDVVKRIYFELSQIYQVVFVDPNLEDEVKNHDGEYNFYITGTIDVSQTKELLDALVYSEDGVETYFMQKLLKEDLDIFEIDKIENEELKSEKQLQVQDEKEEKILQNKLVEEISLQEKSHEQEETAKNEVEDHKQIKTDSIRIDVNKLEVLSNLSGELVTCRAQIFQVLNLIKTNYSKDKAMNFIIEAFEKSTTMLNRISVDFQENVTQLRMFPVKNVFRKIPRLVRDLSNKCGKDIELNFNGEDTELDKLILEQLSDPIMHIIRNSIDHGIEYPKERQAKGKPRKGKVNVSAYNEGDVVYIEIEDDGKGLDSEKIKKKIIQRELATIEEVNKMSEEEIIDFIFKPGFSTSDKANEVSGRGVGMDVVRKNISSIKGDVKVETYVDKGTKITLEIPLTIAIMKCLLISINDKFYLIPLDKIAKTMKLKKENINTISRKRVIDVGDELIPIVSLSEILGKEEKSCENQLYSVVVNYYKSKVGIIVDKLLGEQEVVVKPLDRYIGALEGIIGSTILGNGKVALVLEPLGLIDRIV